jgi:hypothetical protein
MLRIPQYDIGGQFDEETLSIFDLSTSQIQRAGIEVPKVIWNWKDDNAEKSLQFLSSHFSSSVGLWLYVSSEIKKVSLAALGAALRENFGQSVSLILGLTAESIRRRAMNPLQDRLKILGLPNCAAIMLEDVDVLDVKSGWPFHRLGALRDQGLLKMFFTEAHDIAAAEWLVEHSPTYAVSVPFGIEDQSVKFRLLNTARDLGTAIFARPLATNSLDDLRLRASEQGTVAQIESLPRNEEEVDKIVDALAHPMDETERIKLWESYREKTPEPAKPRSAHPPEFGA